MKRNLMRGSAAVAMLAGWLFLGACGGGDDEAPPNVSGDWSGTLTLSYPGGAGNSGPLDVRLTQAEDFASGSAVWGPSGESVSLAGPLDGSRFSFRLAFTCPSGFNNLVLIGEFNGDAMEIRDASGFVCLGAGDDLTVESGSGTLQRTRNDQPL